MTDVATGRELAIPPPPGYRYVEGYDGAFSPAGRFVAVPIASLGRPVRGDRRDRLRVALIDLAQRSAQVVPASRLAGDYRNLTWSRSGELFFASRRGTLMRYRPSSAEARLVGVQLGAPMLDIAAD